MGRRRRLLGGRGISVFWACIIASCLTLISGSGLFSFGSGSSDLPQVAQVDHAEEHGQEQLLDEEPTGSDGTHSPEHETGDHPSTTLRTGSGPGAGHGGGHGDGPVHHSDPIAPVLLWLIIILLSAKVGGDLFDRMGQPAVLGELVAGVVIGNVLFFLGQDFATVLREGPSILSAVSQMAQGADPRQTLEIAFMGDTETISRFMRMAESGVLYTYADLARVVDILSRLGVIILLFLVGLESNFQEMVKVGLTSFLVAIVGVVAPFGLGYLTSYALLPSDTAIFVHLFIGATLCATSVGITARVLKDLNKLQSNEAKIVLGAAVIDDILGLIILAVTQGIIIAADQALAADGAAVVGQTSMAMSILKIVMLAILFLGGAIFVGIKFTPTITRVISKMRVPGMKLIYSLLFAFLLSWLADLIGLAAIVGAFAAGLVLDEVHFKDFKGEHHHLEELIEPIATFLVPIFFIVMGLQVKLETFFDVTILGLAAGITVAAVIGKQVCGLVVKDPTVSKISVGFGMIPRGEVGLIFAAIGKTLTYDGEPVINSGTFSAVVIMVIVTTLLTPPLLKVSLARHDKKMAKNEAES